MNKKLKIGIFVNSHLIPNWAFRMLQQINGSKYAGIELIVKNGAISPSKESVYRKIKDNFQQLLYIGFSKMEDRVFKREDPDAFAQKDICQLLPDTPCITVKPIEEKYSDYFTKDDVKKISSYDIDVFIRLGFRILRGEILNCAKYGIWSYHHGDNRINRGGPPGFWELLEGWPETGSVLQVLTEDLDSGDILYRSYSQTDSLSVNRNKNKLYWKTLSFLPRQLKQLYETSGEEFLKRVRQDNQHPVFYSERLYTTPKNSELIILSLKHYSKYIFRKLRSFLYFEQWILLYAVKGESEFSSSFWRFKRLVPPKDRFWADPFIIFQNGRYYIFIEEFLYKSKKGHISYLIVHENGNYSFPKKIIEQPYHLSYPFVFSFNEELFMIPETCQNRTIELYRCIDFPEKWELATILMKDICAVDSTLFWKDGKWWLFVNVLENEGASSCDELFLFYSTDLFSKQWTPHPKNPVISDVKSSRPAGKIFPYNRGYYRPSQNNSKRDGYGMKVNQIVALDENEYQEIAVSDIEPRWDKKIVGTHTLNFAKNVTVIDGLMRRFKHFG